MKHETRNKRDRKAFVHYTSRKYSNKIYFADVEALIQNSKQQEVKVQQMTVEVSQYWMGINGKF